MGLERALRGRGLVGRAIIPFSGENRARAVKCQVFSSAAGEVRHRNPVRCPAASLSAWAGLEPGSAVWLCVNHVWGGPRPFHSTLLVWQTRPTELRRSAEGVFAPEVFHPPPRIHPKQEKGQNAEERPPVPLLHGFWGNKSLEAEIPAADGSMGSRLSAQNCDQT